MKILACFNITYEFEQLTYDEWVATAKDSDALRYAKKMIDKVDESGIETALRLKDSRNETDSEVLVDAITVADSLGSGFATLLYSAGIHSVIVQKAEPETCSSPTAVAELISDYARSEGYDIVITGCKSSKSEGAKTGALIGEILHCECIPNVQELMSAECDEIAASCRTENGTVRYRIKTPVVLTMDDMYPVYLRIPTLRERMQVKDKEVHIIQNNGFQMQKHKNDPDLIFIEAIDRKRNCTLIDSDSMENNLLQLKDVILKAMPSGEENDN